MLLVVNVLIGTVVVGLVYLATIVIQDNDDDFNDSMFV